MPPILKPASLLLLVALLAPLRGLLATDGHADQPVSFSREIAPLLQRRCATCHNEETSKGGYRLDTFARLKTPGDSELAPLVSGKTADSELYRLLIEPDPHDRMPQKADRLPERELSLIERWIASGADYDGGAPDRPLVELARSAMLHPAPETYARPVPITALAFSPDGQQIAVSSYFEITLWNVRDGSLVRRVGGLPERINSMEWHPTRNLIAIGGGSPAQWGTVAVVDPAAGFQVRFLCDLAETVQSVAFNRDGDRLVSGAGDRSVRIFEIPNGRQVRVVRQHVDWIQSVAFSPDGEHIVSGSRDRTARVINARTGELEATYMGHDVPVLGAVFAPTGSALLSMARSRAVHIWDVKSGDKKAEIADFPAELQHLAIAGKAVLTSASDRLVRVHQFSDRQLLRTLHGHRAAIDALASDSSGEVFASGGHDGEVFIWSAGCETWIHRFVAAPR